MSTAETEGGALVLQPTASAVRKMFRAAARALMANRPLRELARPASGPLATMAKSELAALEATGLSTRPWVGDDSDDPLTKTIVDYMALIETSLGTAQAAALLGVDLSRIRQRIRARSLIGVEYEGEWRLPRFQFERKNVLPGLAEVLAVLPPGLNPLDLATWFLAPNIDLEAGAGLARVTAATHGDKASFALSPRAWLLRGGPPSVVARLAQHL